MTDTIQPPLPFYRDRFGHMPAGGRIKSEPGDFIVEELPAYDPCGEGGHLFLWVEKENVPHEILIRHVASTLGVAARDVGSAGIKDRRGVTRQRLSVPAAAEPRLDRLSNDSIRLLSSGRHRNKLKTGHLAGNRFQILIRDSAADETARAALIEMLARHGFPNYYGEQRFGLDEETLHIGLGLLSGKMTPGELSPARRRFLLRLSLSAVQSRLFNVYLGRRIRDGLARTVLLGDVMQVVSSGGPFVAEDAAAEQRRLEAWETAISGPIFGPKMRPPAGVPAAREAEILSDFDIPPEAFERFPKMTSGTRRPLIVRPGELSQRLREGGWELSFTLPPGVYATSLLREIIEPA